MPICAAVLALAGCVAGPDFVRPAAPSISRYTSASLASLDAGGQHAGAEAAPADWWSLLASPRLDAAVRQALASNRTLAQARATLLAAQEYALAGEAARFPRAELDALAGRQKYGAAFLGPQKLPPFSYYSVGASVSYAFDFAGGVRRTVEEQRALVEYAHQELDASALTISGHVALQALTAAAARAQIANLESLLEDDRQDVQLVQDALDAGSATRVDMLSAESQLANDQTLLPPLRHELSLAEHALALLAGRAPGDWSAPDYRLDEFTLPAQLPVSIPSSLVRQRPDILAAEAGLHAATAAVGVAHANLYPQLTLTATATLQSIALRDLFKGDSAAGGLTGNLVAPLFNHGALRARERMAADFARTALASYEQTVLTAFGQVADALEALDQDAELLRSEERAVATAGENLALTRESYRAGNSGVLQVLEAQRQAAQARVGLVRAQAQRLQDTVRLLLAVGGPVPNG